LRLPGRGEEDRGSHRAPDTAEAVDPPAGSARRTGDQAGRGRGAREEEEESTPAPDAAAAGRVWPPLRRHRRSAMIGRRSMVPRGSGILPRPLGSLFHLPHSARFGASTFSLGAYSSPAKGSEGPSMNKGRTNPHRHCFSTMNRHEDEDRSCPIGLESGSIESPRPRGTMERASERPGKARKAIIRRKFDSGLRQRVPFCRQNSHRSCRAGRTRPGLGIGGIEAGRHREHHPRNLGLRLDLRISRVGVSLAGPNVTPVRTSALAAGGPRRKRSVAVYMPPPRALESNGLVSSGGCCGIGHRLGLNLPAIVHGGITRRTLLVAAWNDPVGVEGGKTGPMREGTPYDRYGQDSRYLFEMGLAWSVVNMLRDNLSPLVRSFLDPMREQYRDSELHVCTHIRQGNNETGDWERKKWRHIDFGTVANATLAAMRRHAEASGATKVTVFVASDSDSARPWFEAHVPEGWELVRPGRVLPKPESGVWFGESGSTTSAVLSQKERDDAMAEAVADVFALGECDALYVPNYSSFSQVGIMLTRGEGNRVLFMDLTRHDFVVYPPPLDELYIDLIQQNSEMRDENDELRNQIARLEAIEFARLKAQEEDAANTTRQRSSGSP
ncbi:hypothetical protein THAOC_00725, partial [Thalassiosira oceanica]